MKILYTIFPKNEPGGCRPIALRRYYHLLTPKKWNVGKGHKLAVVGLGGLGHMGVKFGKAFGAEVTVISTSPGKQAAAKELGADHFVISKDEAQMKSVFKRFDFVLDTVAVNSVINPFLATLKPNGVYVNVGLPAKPWEVSSFSIAVGNKVIVGSTFYFSLPLN